MFDNLSQRLAKTVQNLRGKGRITDENITETLREVRMALLEADVAVPVVKRFIDAVRVKAQGADVAASLTPGQVFVSILHRELVELLGSWGKIPITYAGGAASMDDLRTIDAASSGRIDITVGSALDLFGGDLLRYQDLVAWNQRTA